MRVQKPASRERAGIRRLCFQKCVEKQGKRWSEPAVLWLRVTFVGAPFGSVT